jgi:hypothetical protein
MAAASSWRLRAHTKLGKARSPADQTRLRPRRVPTRLSAKLVVVDLDDVKHRHIIDHALDARRKGKPRILHIRRYEARANRAASLRGIPPKRTGALNTNLRRKAINGRLER